MEEDALAQVPAVVVTDCDPVGSQAHSNLVLHCFGEPEESPEKLQCLPVIALLVAAIYLAQVVSQVGLLFDVVRVRAGLGSHQQLLHIGLLDRLEVGGDGGRV